MRTGIAAPDRRASGNIAPVPYEGELDEETRERLIEAARLATAGRLVASVTHLINTPLAAITLRAEALESLAGGSEGAPSDPKTLRYLRAIGDEARRCQEVVRALRSFGGPLGSSAEPVDVAELCAAAALLVRDEAMLRQIAVRVDCQAGLVPWHGCRARLGQVLLGVLVNAVEATASGGTVSVVARHDGSDRIIVVEDQGQGLPDAVRTRPFRPFTSTRPPESGLGLGLMACDAVAQAIGGALEAESSGRGTRMVIRLPITARPHEVHDAA